MMTEAFLQQGETLAAQGKTPLYFAMGDKLLGVIAVADVVKPDSVQAVAELKAMGLRVVMLTGDNRKTAQAIGDQVGVDAVLADVLPNDKEAVIRRLSESGQTAMVGDGINDAPALTRADVGIAIGAGADVALDAADVVLVQSKLTDVSAAVRLSRQVLKNIHENLFWAFFYNCIGIPIAAGVLVPFVGISLNPMFAAAAMSLSSFCVVTNALRLNLFSVRSAAKDRRRREVLLPDLKEYEKEREEKTMEKTLHVEGMMCQKCQAHVEKALAGVDGVTNVAVDLEAKQAKVTCENSVSDEALCAAVVEAGYEATMA